MRAQQVTDEAQSCCPTHLEQLVHRDNEAVSHALHDLDLHQHAAAKHNNEKLKLIIIVHGKNICTLLFLPFHIIYFVVLVYYFKRIMHSRLPVGGLQEHKTQ